MSVRLAVGLAGAIAVLAFGFAGSASAEVVWLCEPGAPDNPCEISQDTTIQSAGGDRVETPADGPREIDCFYVYPTVSNQLEPNANKDRDPELESIASYQAARFDQRCRIWAPIYRQATLASIGTGYASPSGADRQLAYGDVREAWLEYLEKHNDGRGVVLIGHSQGTFMLRQLLRTEIERDPAQLRRVVSALLLGGNVGVAEGKTVGGDFERTPLCTRRAQVGCVVAYSTFAEDPTEDARFGISREPPAENPSTLPGGPGYEVACTDPRPLAGWEEPLRLLVPSEPFAFGPILAGIVITSNGVPPFATTTWVSPPDRFEGTCERINGAHVLRVDPLPGSRRPTWFPEPNWGIHLVDPNIALDPLVSLVAQQAARWTKPRLRLARRCRDGRLRLTIRGRDRGFVRRATFRLGRKTIARDAEPRFRTTVGRRALRASGARRVRVRAKLRHGAPKRVTLTRRVPRCA